MMDAEETRVMVRHVKATIRYDGPALAGHEMDVRDLAPALLALSDVVQRVNRSVNGSEADLKVLVSADREQRCFMLDISLVQTLFEQARTLLGHQDVQTAKEIAEWVGLIGSSGFGLFQTIKWLSKFPARTSPLIITDLGDGNVQLEINGERRAVPKVVVNLLEDQQTVEAAKRVIQPLEKDGYDHVSFLENDKEVFVADESDVEGMVNFEFEGSLRTTTEFRSEIEGLVRIKSAQYEGSAKWSLLWSGRAISAEMVDEAAEWVVDFQENRVYAPPNSILIVTMSETVELDADGAAVGKAVYQVHKVHDVKPPLRQGGLFESE